MFDVASNAVTISWHNALVREAMVRQWRSAGSVMVVDSERGVRSVMFAVFLGRCCERTELLKVGGVFVASVAGTRCVG